MRRHIYSIYANFGHGWEKVDDTYDESNAYYLLGEYQLAYGLDTPVRIKHKGQWLS